MIYPANGRHAINALVSTVLLLAVVGIGAGAQVVVYSNDFDTGSVEGFSSGKTDVTPVGSRRFLGQYVNQTIQFTRLNLPAHSYATVTFDLFIIRTWDGNLAKDPNGIVIGPDVWRMNLLNGADLLRTTFSNYDQYSEQQSYPGFQGSGDYPRHQGATEVNTLGYTFGETPATVRPMDSVYHISTTFPHNAATLALQFSSSDAQGAADETWGLDNFVVTVSNTPAAGREDIDGNGVANLADVAKLLRILAGLDTP